MPIFADRLPRQTAQDREDADSSALSHEWCTNAGPETASGRANDQGRTDPILPPTFDEAVAKFQRFLQEGGRPSALRWVFREDIVERGRIIFFRMPLPDSDLEAKRLYNEGVERDLGIHLEVYCFFNGLSLAYVWLPKDEEDASYRMLAGLKLSYPEGDEWRKIVGVRSSFRWNWLRWLERRDTGHKWADGIPRREAVARATLK